jgi:hypothetical protein
MRLAELGCSQSPIALSLQVKLPRLFQQQTPPHQHFLHSLLAAVTYVCTSVYPDTIAGRSAKRAFTVRTWRHGAGPALGNSRTRLTRNGRCGTKSGRIAVALTNSW